MRNLLKNNWLSFLVVLCAFLWAFMQRDTLPPQLPSHFDMNGNANSFQSRDFVLAFVPLINIFVLFVLGFVKQLSPKEFDMPESQALMGRLGFGLTLFMMMIYMGMILEGATPQSGIFQRLFVPGFALFLIFIGNYFGKLQRNFFVGIRLPWTLASEANWKRTHRFAGKVFVIAGIFTLFLSVIRIPLWIAMLLLLIPVGLSVIYSYSYFLYYEKS